LSSITVGLGERSYSIRFGHDLLKETGAVCRSLNLGNSVAVVTNPVIGALYAAQVRTSLANAGFTVHEIEIPDGEEFKNIDTLRAIYGRLIEAGLDRGAFVLALGGGVVGDITGFAAATYLRGIPFVQIPTTLLAQVDSSVGGKTGINHEKGKNLIGAFYQPVSVLVDVATLDTLPRREFLSGMAEVVKYGVTLDRDLFDFLCDNALQLLERDRDRLLKVIQRCCELKASIVAQDERETGLRAVLNYGHSFGHAVETLTRYTEYTHGEAVAIGMIQAARISEHLGYARPSETARIVGLLEQLGLPTQLPLFSATAYKDALLRDKKVRDKGLSFVFNKGIGAYLIDRVTEIEPLLKISGIGACDGK
jgi:3-dehydroquinate synthase